VPRGSISKPRQPPKLTPYSAVGDKAIWNLNGPFPKMVEIKGDETCDVPIFGAVPKTTLAYMSAANPVISSAPDKAYAQEMGPVCKDVFKGK
jgi:hypothetical protein